MKKRTLCAIFAALMALSLTACGGNTASQPPDLTGSWTQINSNSEDSYQTAVITGDTIEINWTNAESDTNSLYWAGSFVAPTTTDEPYTWDSVNDKSKTSSALLASGDDAKTFTYEDGNISYSVSALGSTQTVKLEHTGDAPAATEP